jgi:hypothetical protein
MPKRRICVAVLIGLFFSTGFAGIRGPGKYSGVMIFDRWNGCTLYSGVYVMYISEEIKEKLRPYANEVVEINATDVFQPMNPGDGLIKAFDSVGPLWTPSKPPPDAWLEGVQLKNLIACKEGQKPAVLMQIINTRQKSVDIQTEELAPTLLMKQTTATKGAFTPSDGPSVALITRQAFWVGGYPGGESRWQGGGARHATEYKWTIGEENALPQTFQLQPGEKKRIKITFDLPSGEYEFLTGYGGGVHAGRCLAGNCVAFDVDENGLAKKPLLTSNPGQWGVNNDLPEGVIDIRDRLLSKADHEIRTGLLTQFVEKYPQIRKARDFESTVSGQSEKGRISIFFRHTHLGKAKTTDEPIPEKEQFSVLVILQEPPNNSAMGMGPIYPNLGLIGQIHAMAGDKGLEAGLKKLVDDALKPLADFNDSLNAESLNQEEQKQSELLDQGASCKRVLALGPKQYLDLDTGRYVSVPLSSEIDTESLQEQGVDMYLAFESRGSAPPMGQLRSLGLAFRDAPTRQSFQEATAQTVNDALCITLRNLKGPQDKIAYYGGNTLYAFRTAEGKAGIMKILWNNQDGPPQCTIEYRLIPEAFIPDDQCPWGQAVNGVQCRLRPILSSWKIGQIPTLTLDIRNTGEKDINLVPLMEAQCQFQWDGQWYGWAEPLIDGLRIGCNIGSGQEFTNAMEIKLTDFWAELKGKGLARPMPESKIFWGQHFQALSGKHTLRVRFLYGSVLLKSQAENLDQYPVSNPVELILTECEAEREEKTMYLVLDGSPEVSAEVEGLLKKNPQIVESVLGTDYVVKIIPPKPGIDHKIMIIRPDPDIDFDIRIFNPYGHNPKPEVAKKLEDAIREQMQQKSKKP